VWKCEGGWDEGGENGGLKRGASAIRTWAEGEGEGEWVVASLSLSSQPLLESRISTEDVCGWVTLSVGIAYIAERC
jgi:hypothetical protein